MKKAHIIFSSLLVLTILFSGCDSLLDVNSDRLVFPDENQLNSPNDTIYSMVGIFTQVEKLADRFVLLGELRGDLMDITENAYWDLREIYNFEISEDNPFNRIEDYYAVINNCNYLINNIDTAIVLNAKKVMYKEFAAAKAIRAWTYLQIVLNYGTVKYFEKPILSISESDDYVVYSLNELLPVLIEDLEPWTEIDLPGQISLGADISTEKTFFPVRFVLGDLYLWNGNYERAAMVYYDLIEEESYVVDDRFQSTWTVTNGVFVSRELEDQLWLEKFSLTNIDQITLIAGSTEYGQGSLLDTISIYTQEIAPSTTAIDKWNEQVYYYNASVFRNGDLRGDFGSYVGPESFMDIESDLTDEADLTLPSRNVIVKYPLMTTTTSKAVAVYRSAILYLRYAEAVNRAGKPNLAFAVLKHGMSSNTLEVDTIVPRREKYIQYTDTTGIFFDYVNFEDIAFDNNIGVHELGCGNVHFARNYIIPPLSSLQDSILYVENKVIDEMALETAFEGNRFHDLMRIAMRRGDPAYLADRVASKYGDNMEAIRTKLMDENNWHLK